MSSALTQIRLNYDNSDIDFIELQEFKRKEKSIKDPIQLIDIYCELSILGDNIINVKIIGSTQKIYSLRFKCSSKRNTVLYSCTCPDFKLRQGITCKHIYWFGRNYFNNISPRSWLMRDVLNIIVKYSDYDIFPKGKNENCPICFDPINYNLDNTVNCVEQCRNSVHAYCWYKYTFSSHKYNCVICRSDLLDILRGY